MPDLKPLRDVRRFDVFAEYNRLKALAEGRSEDEAKGYGLWLAKIVASRRYAAAPAGRGREERRDRGDAPGALPEERERFRSLDGEPQTDEMFDREIVERMGERFYQGVFAPAIAEHFHRGDRYEAIRDAVRKEWKP